MISDGIPTKFSLYDQLGYLLVGSVGLLLIAGDLWLTSGSGSLPSFALQTALVWIIVAYLLGHIVQAIANIFIMENKDSYSESERKVLDEVRIYFGKDDWSDREAFQHCYILACGRDIAGHVTAFNAYYSLYRGWLLLFAIESVFLVVYSIMIWLSWMLIIMTLAAIVVTVLMHSRRKRYWNYVTSKTLQTFVVIRRLDL